MRAVAACLAVLLLVASAGGFAAEKQVSDDLIYDQVRRKLANDADVKGGAFEVTVVSGVVTLRGVVEREKYKAKAERLTKKIKGVRQVVNQLQIKPRVQ
jgi:osmotically-inducible protein OsmY